MNNTYSRSYVEVLEILKHIPKEDYEKIPKEKIKFYKDNANKEYTYIYDTIEPKISRKAYAILISLYKNYIANEDEKRKITDILKLNDVKSEREKQNNFNSVDIFKNNINVKAENINLASLEIIESKETILKKILNKIKKILHIK